MSKRIAVFFHGLLFLGDPPQFQPQALDIITEQMWLLITSGLEDAAEEIHVGMNGGTETAELAQLIFPPKATIAYHGLQCRNEVRTILMLEQWLPGHEDWYVLWFHAKGCSHPPGDPLRTSWRQCSMKHLVENWRNCVAAMDAGHDAAGTHWMCPPQTPPTQYIFAGNMYWCKASFLATLPSIMQRARIKESGIDSIESRYEPEVILGNGPRLPRIKDFCPNWNPGRPHSI